MGRADNGRTPDPGFDTSGPLTPTYRVEWLLGDVPEEPLDYARKLGAAWAGRKLPLRSLSVHASPAGHVRVALEMKASDVTIAVVDWVGFVFEAVHQQGLGAPGYVTGAAAVTKKVAA